MTPTTQAHLGEMLMTVGLFVLAAPAIIYILRKIGPWR